MGLIGVFYAVLTSEDKRRLDTFFQPGVNFLCKQKDYNTKPNNLVVIIAEVVLPS